jgi:hypothetical protein
MFVTTPERKDIAHDESPAIISDHAFTPRGEWWTLCKFCGLAQAAHSDTTIDTRADLIAYYSDDNPEAFE